MNLNGPASPHHCIGDTPWQTPHPWVLASLLRPAFVIELLRPRLHRRFGHAIRNIQLIVRCRFDRHMPERSICLRGWFAGSGACQVGCSVS